MISSHRRLIAITASHITITGRATGVRTGPISRRVSGRLADAITHGLSNRAIAAQFLITERTVKNHLTVIYSKLDVASRLELAALLMRR